MSIVEIMDTSSPLKELVGKHGRKRRRIYGSEEQELDLVRPQEVTEQHTCRVESEMPSARSQPRQDNICSGCSAAETSSCCSEAHSSKETLIQFTHRSDSPWDSEVDSGSNTSTPDFKRGHHEGQKLAHNLTSPWGGEDGASA